MAFLFEQQNPLNTNQSRFLNVQPRKPQQVDYSVQ